MNSAMPKRKYAVKLTGKEREGLRSIVSKGKSASRTIKRAHVLLRLDNNGDVKYDIDELHEVLGISRTTVINILKDYQRRGIECIWRKKRDNLNTHDKSSFYEAFPPAEALRLAKRFEFHYTPKHGSWLDIAEIELSALSKQCLGKRRIDNLDDLNAELEKWHNDRNNRQKGVDWQFTNEEARIKLKLLYPLVNF